MSTFPGDKIIHTSADPITEREYNYIPLEFLHRLNPSGFLLYKLELKKGVLLMLLRNLNPHLGLYNGIQMILVDANHHVFTMSCVAKRKPRGPATWDCIYSKNDIGDKCSRIFHSTMMSTVSCLYCLFHDYKQVPRTKCMIYRIRFMHPCFFTWPALCHIIMLYLSLLHLSYFPFRTTTYKNSQYCFYRCT